MIHVKICSKHKYFLESRHLFWFIWSKCFVWKLTVVTVLILFMENYLFTFGRNPFQYLRDSNYLCQIKKIVFRKFPNKFSSMISMTLRIVTACDDKIAAEFCIYDWCHCMNIKHRVVCHVSNVCTPFGLLRSGWINNNRMK